jgi:uncharacterized protein
MAVIYIDADACPVIRIIEKIAKKYSLEVVILCDTNHILSSDYSQVQVVGAGTDAVDFVLIQKTKRGDFVVTQDYGVAAMALGKGAFCIHPSGKFYTDENIDILLMERHLAKEARRKSSKNHLKGPQKRTNEDNLNFEKNFEILIKKQFENNEIS